MYRRPLARTQTCAQQTQRALVPPKTAAGRLGQLQPLKNACVSSETKALHWFCSRHFPAKHKLAFYGQTFFFLPLSLSLSLAAAAFSHSHWIASYGHKQVSPSLWYTTIHTMFFVFAEQDQRGSAQVSAAHSTTGDAVILNALFIHTCTICNG